MTLRVFVQSYPRHMRTQGGGFDGFQRKPVGILHFVRGVFSHKMGGLHAEVKVSPTGQQPT